jgi:PAB1-binding protein PBP1
MQGNIADNQVYKLDVQLSGFPNGTNQLDISRWMPETGWTQLELFLTDEEVDKIRTALK